MVAKNVGVASAYYNFNEQSDIVKLFRQASAKLGGSWVPTIIAEVDRGIDTTIKFKYQIKLLWS